jgi:hypothetical protein
MSRGLGTAVAIAIACLVSAVAQLCTLSDLNVQLGVTVYLRRVDDESYCGNFSLGSPPQAFLLRVDTSSGDIWVPSQSAADAANARGFNHSFFFPNASSTYVDLCRLVHLPYPTWGSGVSAEASQDNIRF